MQLSENAQSILNGFNSRKIKETNNETLREQAREKIYYDVQFGRISDDEADYLFNQFNL